MYTSIAGGVRTVRTLCNVIMEKNNISSARVILWCAPRCTSNLFAKCVTAIQGNEVWIEPFQYSQFAHNEMKRMGLIESDGPFPYSHEGNEDLFEKAAGGIAQFLGSEIKPQRLP